MCDDHLGLFKTPANLTTIEDAKCEVFADVLTGMSHAGTDMALSLQ